MDLTQAAGNPVYRFYKNPNVRFMFFGALLCLVPYLKDIGVFNAGMLITIGGAIIYSVAALGLNLLLGFAGLISLGVAGFVGLGAYATAYFTKDLGLAFWVAALGAIALATLIGLLVGLVSLRVSGLYLAIATLCVSEILLKTFESFDSITGGMTGKRAAYPTILGTTLTREGTYIMLVIVLVLLMMLTRNLVKGSFGRALHAMRGSEVAAQAMGVNLLKYRLLAFALSTAYAALAGALYVTFIRSSYPTTWTITLSLNILAVVVIGGFRSIYGTILGSFVAFIVPDLILKKLPVIGDVPGLAYIFNGVMIIIVIMFYPAGLIKLFSDARGLALRLVSGKARKAVN
ncbi:MAG: branched-chain amino acid ABC transporter permease [Oscillospiraceae bacterium]|nr:branched-chain amino acid ABC transporter permease [Oscillospiraceae bacterium]